MSSLPPAGIKPGFMHVLNGSSSTLNGDRSEWMSFDQVREYTNAFIVQDGKILLGYKKRGFGKYKYNGFGGKVEPGETSFEAAERELEEEAGVKAPLSHAGTLFFLSEDSPIGFNIEIYRSDSYSGTVIETDEMRPEWFSTTEIPFAKMWESDVHWMPFLLNGIKFSARADLTSSGCCNWWIGQLYP